MNSTNFSGTGVALVTPFDASGAIDFPALKRVVNHCIDGGVDYLVALGTTGEAITLCPTEIRQVLDFILKINDGRLPVVAGPLGHNDTVGLINRIKNFNFDGFAGILSSSPSYNKPTQEGIYQHYMAIANVAPLPIIIYNVPSRTASTVTPETILRIAHASDRFVAVKDATADLVGAAKIVQGKPEHFQLLSGDDPTCLPLLSVGGTGVISVIGNLLPGPYSQMVQAARSGDFVTARAIHLATIHLHHWLYVEGNPAGIKAALEIAGICERHVKLPLVPYSSDRFIALKKEVATALKALRNVDKIN